MTTAGRWCGERGCCLRTYRPLCMCGACAFRQCPAHTDHSVCAVNVHSDNAPHIQTTLYVRGMCIQTMPRTYRPLCMCGACAFRQCPSHTDHSVCAGHVHSDNAPHIQTTLYVRRTCLPHIQTTLYVRRTCLPHIQTTLYVRRTYRPHIQITLYVRRTYRPHIRSMCKHSILYLPHLPPVYPAYIICTHSSYASHLPRADPVNLKKI